MQTVLPLHLQLFSAKPCYTRSLALSNEQLSASTDWVGELPRMGESLNFKFGPD